MSDEEINPETMKAINRMKDVGFPKVGDYFSVKYTRRPGDGSFRTEIFKCTGADTNLLVANFITGIHTTNRYIFARNEWLFMPVSESVLNAIGICLPKDTDPSDAEIIEDKP